MEGTNRMTTVRNLISCPQAGFGNRIRSVCSDLILANLLNRKPWICWTPVSSPIAPDGCLYDKKPKPFHMTDRGWACFFKQDGDFFPPADPSSMGVDKIFSLYLAGEYWHPFQSCGQKKWLDIDPTIPIIRIEGNLPQLFECNDTTILIESSGVFANPDTKSQTYQKHFVPHDRFFSVLEKKETVDVVVHIRKGDLLWYFKEAQQDPSEIENWICESFKNKSVTIISDDYEFKNNFKKSLISRGISVYTPIWGDVQEWEVPFLEFLFAAFKCNNLFGTPISSFSEEAGFFGGKLHYSPIPILVP